MGGIQQELKQGQGRKGSNMPKGNRINHKCVYARDEDLIELKQRFMGAELARKRAGKKTVTGMSEKQLKEFARTKRKKLPVRKKK